LGASKKCETRTKIPYGGFSPVRLQGWLVGQCLPSRYRRLAPHGLPLPFVHPVASHGTPALCRDMGSVMHRHSSEPVSLYPRGPRSGPGCSVPVHLHLFGPMRPTRRHTAISPFCGLYAMPSLCVSASATHEWFRAFADCYFLACRPLRPRRTRWLLFAQHLRQQHRPSPT